VFFDIRIGFALRPGHDVVASQRPVPLSAPLAPARLALTGRPDLGVGVNLRRCVAPLPAAWLTPLTPVRVALRVPKRHGLVSRLPSPLGFDIARAGGWERGSPGGSPSKRPNPRRQSAVATRALRRVRRFGRLTAGPSTPLRTGRLSYKRTDGPCSPCAAERPAVIDRRYRETVLRKRVFLPNEANFLEC
jgi:hypothetical protein